MAVQSTPINNKKSVFLAWFFQSDCNKLRKLHAFCINSQVDASGNSLLSIVPLPSSGESTIGSTDSGGGAGAARQTSAPMDGTVELAGLLG